MPGVSQGKKIGAVCGLEIVTIPAVETALHYLTLMRQARVSLPLFMPSIEYHGHRQRCLSLSPAFWRCLLEHVFCGMYFNKVATTLAR